MAKYLKYTLFMSTLLVALFLGNIFCGSVDIPSKEVLNILCGGEAAKESWKFIILDSRLPQAITALLSGPALAVCGLLLQTYFNNPLAGPSILGINSGASLGVAVVMLIMGGSVGVGALNFTGFLAVLVGAIIGSLLVMAILLLFSSFVKGNLTLLIIGIMVGYLTSSAISLLNFFATTEGVHSYVIWGMGTFGGVSSAQLPYFSITVLIGLVASVLMIKPLNALLLGERYAENLGVNIRKIRNLILLTVGLLTACVTAFCGPIAFIGLAVPHISRLLIGSSNHTTLLPFTLLTGAVMALLCNLSCILPGNGGILPLNAITPLLGAPVIIYVLVNQRKIQYFN
ncbi:MAG: iron ABC transporter permease [Bacteroidales bacterium]|nr:iron ABC transporter permease [Candidatus Scybalocola fimicaballi]